MERQNVYFVISIICIVIVIIGVFLFDTLSDDKKEKQIVCPTIKKEGLNTDNLNSKIKDTCMRASKNENNVFEYRISDNQDIYSVVTLLGYYEADATSMTYEVETYNIDKKSNKELTEDDLLNKYDLTENEVNHRIEEILKYYYQDEINQGYLLEENCSYQCFLELRGLQDGFDNSDLKYYVGSEKLFAYLPFQLESYMADEKYYSEPIKAFRMLLSY